MSIAGLPAAGLATVCGGHRGKGSTAGQSLRFVPLLRTHRINLSLYVEQLSDLLVA